MLVREGEGGAEETGVVEHPEIATSRRTTKKGERVEVGLKNVFPFGAFSYVLATLCFLFFNFFVTP